ncbi:DUF1178 family protein [Jiella endophytica]|uniref:DUF1178 family protein n=1 Tax=Jiella endophytica TaxID=2558362 RepID=A0A4Y8R9B9_9HYPH|nr:DUF1178 family protein [Jiella endophytica]TFF18244.1 DUF1178 family protein [Jiella endophytica]
MIHFQLRCRPSGHGFDGWFRSSADFERQAEAGLVECPVCRSGEVEKALMRPAIAKGDAGSMAAAMERASGMAAPEAAGPSGEAQAGPGGAVVPAGPAASPQTLANFAPTHPEVAKAFAALQAISRKVRAEADYVGPKFAEEARRIHYGESEARQIFGEASKQDVEGLKEEGITALPLMPLPEDGQ